MDDKVAPTRSPLTGLLAALVIVGGMTGVKAALGAWFAHDEDLLFLGAIALAAWGFGPRSGAFVVALAAISQMFLAARPGALVITDPARLAGIGGWAAEGALLCYVFHRLEGAQRRAHDAAAAERSERLMRRMFDATPTPMVVVDRDSSQFLEANAAALALYGYPRAEMLAMSMHDIRARALPSDDAKATTVRHRTADGSILQVNLTATPSSYDGKPARIVIVNRAERAGIDSALPPVLRSVVAA